MTSPVSNDNDQTDESNGQADSEGAAVSSFPLRRLLTALRRYWWIPVSTLLLSLVATAAYVRRLPPTYISTAQMWETMKIQMPGAGLFSEDVQNFLGTQTELLESATLRGMALARLRETATNVAIPNGADGKPLVVHIRVTGTKSAVFTIEATSSDATYTRDYLNALMDVYLEYKRNVRKRISLVTLESITKQLESTEVELTNEQAVLLVFEQSNSVAVLQQDGAVASSYLANLKTKLSDLQMEERLLRASMVEPQPTEAGATNTGGGPALAEAPSAAGADAGRETAPEAQSASRELELLKAQRAKLSKFLRPKHPKIVKLDESIEHSERSIEIYRRQTHEQQVASLRTIKAKLENMRSLITEWEKKAEETNTRLAEAERLKVNIQRVQNQYDRLNMMVENLSISRNIDQENLDVLDRARRPTRSYTRETTLVTGGGIGGLGLGLGIILLLGFRDDRFTSVSEINKRLGHPVMGQVPALPGLGPDARVPLVEIDDQRHAYAESFRNLRSALVFMVAESERPRVVLVTSAVPHEGKSTIAANLARMLALGGYRVVLIDGDLRRGALHEALGLRNEPGLAELLREPENLGKFIQTNGTANLAFISRGKASAKARDLFLCAALDQIITRLREQFDYVIIDGSPVFASDDASTLAPQVDGTLFVVRSRFSSPGPTLEALEILYQRRAKVLGVIFNRADARASSNYYYKYPEYYGAEKA